ncbi:MAG: DUF2169 domain-containing protein [Neisseriaceae bacterium]|nr:MAG: DUF2169 domain-containing protein [Neisseriaceae bacterium]
MKIVKPQQLVFLKNAYQLEKNCYLGISAIAGCYLDKTNHFITEPEVWDVWDKSPKSVPFLDVPVVKQFAEYVLVGHASIGKEVSFFDAEVNVGKLKKQWRIFGEGSYIRRKKFYGMSMDHVNVWGGVDNQYNPLGKGNTIIDNAPNVVLRKEDRLFERESLASPSPIPFNFNQRKKYIDKIAPTMASSEYLDKVYPGYPKGFDLRYFQIASPDQWLDSVAWPSGSSFLLRGFAQTEDTIKGNFPKVSARAFGSNDNKIVDEIPLLLQTIWLVPNFNVALLVFTGEIQIGELTEEPYDVLLLALDNDGNPRDRAYYFKVLKKRLSKESKLDSLLDLDLMPEDHKINVIHSMENHPSSIRYTPGPMNDKEVDQYFEEIEKAIKFSKMSESNQDIKNLGKAQKNEINFNDVFSLSNEYKFQDKDYGKFYSYSTTIVKKEFSNCQFKDIDFSRYEFINCVFQRCNFYDCIFDGNIFNKSNLEDSKFVDCTMKNLKISDTQLTSLQFSATEFEKVVCNNCQLSESKIENCYLYDVRFLFVQINGVSWIKSKIDCLIFSDSLIIACTFKNTHLISVDVNKSRMEKNSIVYSSLKSCSFDKSGIFSFVVGLESGLENCTFRDCWLEKIGMGNTIVKGSFFEYCNIKEINGSYSDFSSTKFTNCDVMTAIFKDATLVKTEWKECGLQQSIFYNSNLVGAVFLECNLIGSNLALIDQNENTTFKGCLLDKVLWIPKRN